MDWRKANCIVRVVTPPKSSEKLYMDLIRLDVNNNVLHQLHRHDNQCQASSGPASLAMHSTLARRDRPRRAVVFPRRLSSIHGSFSEGAANNGYDLILSRISDDTMPDEVGNMNGTNLTVSGDLCLMRETAV